LNQCKENSWGPDISFSSFKSSNLCCMSISAKNLVFCCGVPAHKERCYLDQMNQAPNILLSSHGLHQPLPHWHLQDINKFKQRTHTKEKNTCQLEKCYLLSLLPGHWSHRRHLQKSTLYNGPNKNML